MHSFRVTSRCGRKDWQAEMIPMPDFLANRQNPVSTQRPDELNQRLGAIDRYFGSSWLSEDGDHPLKLLWARRDALATVELLNFEAGEER